MRLRSSRRELIGSPFRLICLSVEQYNVHTLFNGTFRWGAMECELCLSESGLLSLLRRVMDR